jgi:hypothetical protein
VSERDQAEEMQALGLLWTQQTEYKDCEIERGKHEPQGSPELLLCSCEGQHEKADGTAGNGDEIEQVHRDAFSHVTGAARRFFAPAFPTSGRRRGGTARPFGWWTSAWSTTFVRATSVWGRLARSLSTRAWPLRPICVNGSVNVAFAVSKPFQPPARRQVILSFHKPNPALSLAQQFCHLEGLALLDREGFHIPCHLEPTATMALEMADLDVLRDLHGDG